jgi:hypothetical protein
MNIKKRVKNTAIVMAVLISTSSTVFAANTYTDIPSTHWAYASITRVADKGIMVGDGTQYNPSEVINKFEASRILARVAGYSTADGYTPLDTTTNFINRFKEAFPLKWGAINKDYENCIAYLYEKQILNSADLNKFAIKYTDGSEAVRNLTREEMAVYLVRTMGKAEEASAYSGGANFADDSAITENAKASIYYLKSQSVIFGDTSNNFNPTNSITKVEMAVFLDRAIYSKTNTPTTTNTPIVTVPTENNTSGTINVTTDQGKINTVYATANVISLTNVANQIKTYKIASTAKVYIDGTLSTLDRLVSNMPIVVTVVNTEVVELRATSVAVTTPTTTTPTTTTPTNPDALTTREYSVASISSLNNTKVLSVVVQMVKPSGDTYKETQSFTLASDCTIKKNDKTISFLDIQKDDTVTIKYSGGVVYSIVVDEATMSIKNAELIDKKLNSENVPILTIKTSNGTTYDLKVVSASDLRRKGEGTVKWQELCIGDVVEVDKNYNTVSYLYAVGDTSTEDGWVDKIVISEDLCSVTLRDKYDKKTEYRVSSPAELYSLKLNSKIKLSLDSKEVDSIKVLSEEDTSTTLKGTIDTLKYNYMYVDRDKSSSVKVTFNTNTKVYDAVVGKTVTIDDLKTDMYVTVTFTNDKDNIAERINIVSK